MSIERTRQPFRRPPEPIVHLEPKVALPNHQPEEHAKNLLEFQGEATPETLKAYLDYLAESGRKFDSALSHYYKLLQAQEGAERSIQALEQLNQNSQRFAEIKAKAAKLAWAVTRYVTSSSIIGTGVGAGAYMLTKDPAMTALATAGGAMAGSAVEFGLSRMEESHDYSERWFAQYPELERYRAAKQRRAEQRAGTPENRNLQITTLTEELRSLREEIHEIELEIDRLGSDGNVKFKDPRQPAVNEPEPAVTNLIEQIRTAGQRLNELLAQYFELAVDAEDAEQYLAARQHAYDARDASIQLRVTAHQIWEMLKVAHITLGTAGIMGMAGVMYNVGQTGEPNIPMAALGAAAGAAIGWFQVSRVEKNIWQHNLPRGQYQAHDQAARHADFQKAIDPHLNQYGDELDQAQAEHTRLQAEQAKLSAELEAFMAKYPMQS